MITNFKKRKQGVAEFSLGLAGILLCFILPSGGWCYIPLVILGILSAILIGTNDELTEEEKNVIKKRNLPALIVWIAAMIGCYLIARLVFTPEWPWFVLSTYVFLTTHGALFLAPIHLEKK
ncbi:MAG: hypothetical protein IJ986_06525 [Bacteroidales bacterium]|nr:hypothetical protein [Bacteroidales bacterium]